MSRAVFVLSTGRCTTQALARAVAGLVPGAVVEHEGLNARYMPRRVYRKPRALARALERSGEIEAKFREIEDLIATGRRYVDTGWPVYAWIPYLRSRLVDAMGFVHLVRNPFDFAASMLTHRFYVTSNGRYKKQGVIFGTDKKLIHSALAAGWEGFSAYEKCLFHWLELNAFGMDCHDLPGFRGLYRFEDVHSGDGVALQALLSELSGAVPDAACLRVEDKVHVTLREPIVVSHSALFDAVIAQAEALGYDGARLRAGYDPKALAQRYGAARWADRRRRS